MRAHGQTTVWGTPISVGRATDAKGWYQQLKAWQAARQAARHDAVLVTLSARWDARREAVTPHSAEAAPEMAAAQHTLSVATMLYGLGVSAIEADPVHASGVHPRTIRMDAGPLTPLAHVIPDHPFFKAVLPRPALFLPVIIRPRPASSATAWACSTRTSTARPCP